MRQCGGGGWRVVQPSTMKFLCWNPHGLGNPRGFRSLHDLIKKKDSDIIFLKKKKKVKASFFSTKKLEFRYNNTLGVDCEDKSGRLAIMLKEDIQFEILQFLNHHIHGIITTRFEGEGSQVKWSLTGVYNHPEAARREEFGA